MLIILNIVFIFLNSAVRLTGPGANVNGTQAEEDGADHEAEGGGGPRIPLSSPEENVYIV